MTEKLKTLMDEAAGMTFTAPDLDAITKAGDRTVRRRRVATGLAGMAAVAAIVTGIAVVAGGPDNDRVDPAGTFRTDVPMWTVGSTLHTPDATFDVGHEVAAFVRTSEGIVFAAHEGGQRFGVYAFDGGEAKRIGETGWPMLKSDPEAPYAAWSSADDPEAEEWTNVVYDQQEGQVVWERAGSGGLAAIDGSRLFLADNDAEQMSVVDVTTGEETIPEDMQQYVLAVKGDRWVGHLEDEEGADLGITLHDGASATDVVDVDAGSGAFSPDGAWLLVMTDELLAFDVASGEQVALDRDHPDAVAFEWIDEDTLLAIDGVDADGPAALLSCDVPSGGCQQVVALPELESGGAAALGLGFALWGDADYVEESSEDNEGSVNEGAGSSGSMALVSDYQAAADLIESLGDPVDANEFVAADGSIFCDIDGRYEDVAIGAGCQLSTGAIEDPDLCAPETDGMNVIQFVDGVPHTTCATDTMWQQGVIGISESVAVKAGDVTCAVEVGPDATAVTCIDAASGRGFGLTPGGYSTF